MNRQAIQRLLSSTSAILLLSTGVTMLLSYGVQILMARSVAPELFPTIQALYSWYAIIAIPVSSLTQLVSAAVAQSGNLTLGRFKSWMLRGVVGGFAAPVVAFVFAPWVTVQYELSIRALLTFSLTISATFIYSISQAVLTGLLKFRYAALMALCGTLLRLVFLLPATQYGGSIEFIAYGHIFSLLLIAGWSSLVASREFQPTSASPATPALDVPFVRAVIGWNLAFALLSNLDLVVLKALFPGTEAVAYTAATLLARTLVFGPGAITQMVFVLSGRGTEDALSYRSFMRMLRVYAVSLVAMSALYIFFGPFILPVLLGRPLPPLRFGLLISCSIYSIMALTTLCFSFLLPKRRTRTVGWSLGIACVPLLALGTQPTSLYSPLGLLLGCCALVAVLALASTLAGLGEEKRTNG
jgi:O-antigen/teichoic acid export membrane protein